MFLGRLGRYRRLQPQGKAPFRQSPLNGFLELRGVDSLGQRSFRHVSGKCYCKLSED
jgi:hypothetical protein